MPRPYTIPIDIASFQGASPQETICIIRVPATVVVELLSVQLKNASEESSEQLKVALRKITDIGGAMTTGTSVTPQKHEEGNPASVVTTEIGLFGTEPTTYETANRYISGDPSIAGMDFTSIPEARRFLAPSTDWGIIHLPPALTNAINLVGVIEFEEIG